MKHVYVISRRDGCVKIGASNNPSGRCNAISRQMRSPVNLQFQSIKTENFDRIESTAHRLCAGSHVEGEWFRTTVEDASQSVITAFHIAEGSMPDPTDGTAINRHVRIRFHPATGRPWVVKLKSGIKAVYPPAPYQMRILERLEAGENIRQDSKIAGKRFLITENFVIVDDSGFLRLAERGHAVLNPERYAAPNLVDTKAPQFVTAYNALMDMTPDDRHLLCKQIIASYEYFHYEHDASGEE